MRSYTNLGSLICNTGERETKKNRRLILHVLLAAVIVLSACTATQAAPTSKIDVSTAPIETAVPMETEPPTPTDTPSAAPPNGIYIFGNSKGLENQEWQYVALGVPFVTDNAQRYPNILAEKIEQGQHVNIRTYSMGGSSSTELLENIKGSELLRKNISNADMITFVIPLDGFIEASFLYADTPDQCGGDDHQSCLRVALETYKQDTEDFVSELVSLIDMDSTVVLAHTSLPGYVTYSKEAGTFDVLNAYWKEANAHLISVCVKYGIPVAKVYEAFMGTDGSKNLEEDGLLESGWLVALEPEGHELVANLLYELGSSPGTNESVDISQFGMGDFNDIAVKLDGKVFAVAGNGGIWVYDLESLETLLFISQSNVVVSVAWSPDGQKLASVDFESRVRIWDANTGEQLAELAVWPVQDAWYLVWSPDGQKLASLGAFINDKVYIWDVGSGEQLAVLEGYPWQINSVAWSPDGQKLASGGLYGNVRIWDANSGEQLAELEGLDWIDKVVWSPDGQKLAAGGNSDVGASLIHIWDVASGEQLAELDGLFDWVSSLAWSPDGQKLASGGFYGKVRIWDAGSWEQLAVLGRQTHVVNNLAWSPDGQQLISVSVDGTVRIWEILGEYGAEPADVPRELTAAEVQRTAAAFEALADNTDAYQSGDVEALLANYTDDIVHNDSTFFAHRVGIDKVGSMISNFIKQFAKAQSQFTEMYINSEDGIAVYEMWEFHVGTHLFTQEEPLVEVDLLETRNGRISYWTLFYGLDTLEAIKGGASAERLDEASALLSSYGEVWSSGDPQMFRGLYAGDAVREDTLFQERQEGQNAIMSFAESFFTWYPDAQWNLLLPFGEGHGTAMATGGVYAVNVSDPDGQPCEVHISVVFNTAEDQIVQETLYYQPDSLISCGWVE